MQFVENSLSTAKHTQEPFLLYALVIQMLPKSTNTKNDLSWRSLNTFFFDYKFNSTHNELSFLKWFKDVQTTFQLNLNTYL